MGAELVSADAVRAVAAVRAARQKLVAVEAELCALLAAVSADLASEQRRVARRTRRAIRAGRDVPAVLDLGPGVDQARWAALVALRADDRAALAAAELVCGAVVAGARQRERRALRSLMRDRRVGAAAALTSRSLATGIRRALSDDADDAPPRLGPATAIERRMLLVLQRLTAKPAMMAHAGPCFWGTLDGDRDSALHLEVGDGLVRARRVFFEHWAIAALARAIQSDPEVAPHCVVRLNPGCLLDGTTLFYPINQRLRLDPLDAQVVTWCSEGQTLAAIRRRIAAHPDGARAELDKALANHLRSGVATCDIPLPAVKTPEHDLRRFLAGLPDDCAAGPRWLAILDRMIALREALEGVRGVRGVPGGRGRDHELDPQEREALEGPLDAVFREAAGVPPTRNPGQLHGARFVTYEDCGRDVEVTLGRPVCRDLAELAPALDLASWIARTCADRYEQRLLPLHARLARKLATVDFITFIREAQWITDTTEVVDEVRRDLRRAWERQLGDRLGDDGPVELEPDDFRGVLDGLEPCEARGWLPAADCHALSVLAGAASPAAFAAGDYELVLDKLYKGVPMWIHPAALPFCPAPAEEIAAFEAWSREPILQLVDPASSYHRSNLNLPVAATLWEVALPNTAPRSPPERVVPCSQLEVIQDGGRLYACSHDRRIQSGLFTVRWPFLQHKLLGIPVHPENPEPAHAFPVRMRRWLLARESWRFATDDLLRRWDRARPMSSTAAWQAEHGIPDRVFAKLPAERKSVALDLRSVLCCDLLRALAATGDELRVTEMVPAPERCWLADGFGAGHVAELRFTVLRHD
jgi:hypothetical protein